MRRRRITKAGAKTNVARPSKCKSCANCIFEETWGEYKCKAHTIRLYNIDKIYECEEYEQKKQ